jgi:anti-sigma regulatory factor (Ser/Thr protein kinase)
VLALSELVDNAIQHGGGDCPQVRTQGVVVVRVEVVDRTVILEVEEPFTEARHARDLAERFAHPELPPPLDERGRGLFLVSHMLDRIQVTALQGGGLRVRGEKDVGGSA